MPLTSLLQLFSTALHCRIQTKGAASEDDESRADAPHSSETLSMEEAPSLCSDFIGHTKLDDHSHRQWWKDGKIFPRGGRQNIQGKRKYLVVFVIAMPIIDHKLPF